MRNVRINAAASSFFLAMLFLFSSCAPGIKHYPKINQYLLQQDFDSALSLLKKNRESYAGRNALLYHLDEGIIAHFAGHYEESTQSLSIAESIDERLYTMSISRQATSFLINDNTIPYRGEDFERTMINLFMALNYAGLGQWEDALVEARKADNKLNIINYKYDAEERNVYKEDGFIRFLMGVLYESEGETNDAYISYRKAEAVYRTDYLPNYGISPPSALIENLLTAAQAMGFYEEMVEISNQYPDVAFPGLKKKNESAEVFFVHHNGVAPEKVDTHLLVPMPDGFIIKIAYPILVKRPYRISHGEITLRNPDSGESYSFLTILMEDIGAIADMNLRNRINRIKTKAIVRATMKYLASKRAEKIAEEKGGELAGLAVRAFAQLAGIATEQADVRNWRLLPAEIRLGRALIPPGRYRAKIKFMDSGGAVVSHTEIAPFSVSRAEKRFFILRTLN